MSDEPENYLLVLVQQEDEEDKLQKEIEEFTKAVKDEDLSDDQLFALADVAVELNDKLQNVIKKFDDKKAKAEQNITEKAMALAKSLGLFKPSDLEGDKDKSA